MSRSVTMHEICPSVDDQAHILPWEFMRSSQSVRGQTEVVGDGLVCNGEVVSLSRAQLSNAGQDCNEQCLHADHVVKIMNLARVLLATRAGQRFKPETIAACHRHDFPVHRCRAAIFDVNKDRCQLTTLPRTAQWCLPTAEQPI